MADNSSRPSKLFNGRKAFDETSLFQKEANNYQEPVNFQKDKRYYGFLDYEGTPVQLADENLAQVPSKGSDFVYLLKPAADAFEEFVDAYQEAMNREYMSFDNSSFPQNAKAKKGWKNFDLEYSSYINHIFDSFVNKFLIKKNNKNDIYEFKEFVNNFFAYLEKIKTFPFTKTGYILSKRVEPHVTGLFVDIKKFKSIGNQQKTIKVFDDGNFKFYTKLARRFGFMVSKRQPFRLVFDIENPASEKYFGEEVDQPEQIFDEFFLDTKVLSYKVMKQYLIDFYNLFVDREPE